MLSYGKAARAPPVRSVGRPSARFQAASWLCTMDCREQKLEDIVSLRIQQKEQRSSISSSSSSSSAPPVPLTEEEKNAEYLASCEELKICHKFLRDQRFKNVAFQLEKGHDNGRVHVHCWLYYPGRGVTLATVLKLFPSGTHCEPSGKAGHSSPIACFRYCTKKQTKGVPCRLAGPWFRHTVDEARRGDGAPNEHGKRRDLDGLYADLSAGVPELEIADKYFSVWMRNHNAIAKFQLLHSTPRTWFTLVVCLWGTTGLGKTHFCTQFCEVLGLKPYRKPDGPWYDGYDPVLHRVVIFDDFYGNKSKEKSLTASEFLKATDRYPHSVPVRCFFLCVCF